MNKQKTIAADTKLATVAGHDTRVAAFRTWGKAEGTAGAALVACYLACAQTGQTDATEIGEARPELPSKSCEAYASAFNRAAKVADVLGIGATVDLIGRAVKGSQGRAREAIADALGAALSTARQGGIKRATKAEASKVAKAALVAVAEKAADRKAVKVAGHKRGTKSQDTATMGAAAIASGKGAQEVYHAVRLVSNNAQRMAAPEGREAAWNAALAKLADACEALAVFK
jgi:hypothetical protein